MLRVDNFNTPKYNNYNINTSAHLQHSSIESFGAGQSHRSRSQKEKPITMNEGISIIEKGIKTQCIDSFNSLIGNPKAIIGLLGFSAALALLPLFSIPVSVGGGILAIGFGTAASIKTFKHAKEFIKNNRDKKYNLARKNLETIGEDSVDLALSLPFVPKSVSKLGTFFKYGQVKLNKDVLKNSKSLTALLFKNDAVVERKLYFTKSAAKELKKNVGNLSKQELSKLSTELEEYNVPYDKLPIVVLDKWAQERKIYTKPKLATATMQSHVAGFASADECTIILNDYKSSIPAINKYETVEVKLVGDTYKYTYKDRSTGKIIIEEVQKKIVDDYSEHQVKVGSLSPQLARIMTTIHEREHIDQYARMVMNNGMNIVHPTDSAKVIYKAMAEELAKQGQTIEQSAQTAEMAVVFTSPKNGTMAQYMKNPLELGARRAERQALENPFYTHLDNIYKKVNAQTPKPSMNSASILNTLRVDSLTS